MTEDMRERFEKWARNEAFVGPVWNNVDPCKRDASGDYYYIDVRNAWRSWQAALSFDGTSGTAAEELTRTERVAFENHFEGDLSLQRDGQSGEYLEGTTFAAWRSWQARAALEKANRPNLANVLCNACQILDVVKLEWGAAWSEWDQSVRDELSRELRVALRGDSLSGKGEATKKCPKCGGEIVSTAHGLYCPKPTCKWGWEIEMDGSPLQPPSAPAQPAGGAREWRLESERDLVKCPRCGSKQRDR